MLRSTLAFLVLFGVVVGLLWLRPSLQEPLEAETHEPEAGAVEPDHHRNPARVQSARLIAPEAVAVPEIDAMELTRLEPRAPLSPLGTAPDPADLPPRARVLHRPVVLAAGLVEAQGHVIALAGIKAVDPEELCEHGGRNWPCGAHARTAFRNYLRARALSCVVPAAPLRETISVGCTVGGRDPALWLAENGWVREGTTEYEDAIAAAREAGRGLFGPPPGG